MIEFKIKPKGAINICLAENKGACISLVGKYLSKTVENNTGDGGGSIDISDLNIITSDSFVESSDENIYSAKRADAEFVSAKNDDTVEGNINFINKISITGTKQSLDSPVFSVGNFIEEGDLIQGAGITKRGIGSFAGIKSPWMQIYELVYNRKTALQGEFSCSDYDTVESVHYKLTNGNTAMMKSLFIEAQKYSIITGIEKLSLDLIKDTFIKYFSTMVNHINVDDINKKKPVKEDAVVKLDTNAGYEKEDLFEHVRIVSNKDINRALCYLKEKVAVEFCSYD